MNTKKLFDEINQTGTQFLIFKNVGKCYCVKSDGDLFERTPSAYCPNCLGTGFARSIILTEKVRNEITSNKSRSNIEKQNFERHKDEKSIIFFNANYLIDTTDIIASIFVDDENNAIFPIKPKTFYKVISVFPFVAEKFKFFEVVVDQIDYLPYKEVLNEL